MGQRANAAPSHDQHGRIAVETRVLSLSVEHAGPDADGGQGVLRHRSDLVLGGEGIHDRGEVGGLERGHGDQVGDRVREVGEALLRPDPIRNILNPI